MNQKEIDFNEFKKMLKNVDWTYHYSDDSSVYEKGQREFANAVQERQRLMSIYPNDDFFIRQIWERKGRM